MDVTVVGGGDTAMEDALVLARTSASVTVVHRRGAFRASKVLADRVLSHPSISVHWNATVESFHGRHVAVGSVAEERERRSGGSSSKGEGEQEQGEEEEGEEEEEEEEGGYDEGEEEQGGRKGEGDITAVATTTPVLTHVIVRDTQTGAESRLNCSAAFVAIGHAPNTGFARGQLEMDETGYLRVGSSGGTHATATAASVDGVFAAGDVADKVYRQAVTSAGTGAAAALDAERWLSERGIRDEEKELEDELMAELRGEFEVEAAERTSAMGVAAQAKDEL